MSSSSAVSDGSESEVPFERVHMALMLGEDWAKGAVLKRCFDQVLDRIESKFRDAGGIDRREVVHSAFSTFFRRPVASRTDPTMPLADWGHLLKLLFAIAANKWRRKYGTDREVPWPEVAIDDGERGKPIDLPAAELIIPEDEEVPDADRRGTAFAELLDQISSTEEQARQRYEALRSSLTDEEKLILRLHLAEGYTFKEIADELSRAGYVAQKGKKKGQPRGEEAVKKIWQRKMAPHLLGVEPVLDQAEDAAEKGAAGDSALSELEKEARGEIRNDVFDVLRKVTSSLTVDQIMIFRGMLEHRKLRDIKANLAEEGFTWTEETITELWKEEIWPEVEAILVEHHAEPPHGLHPK